VATLVFGSLYGFYFEFIQEFSHGYTVTSMLMPFKLFGVLPIDNILGHTEMTLFTLTFYQHFISPNKYS
jgi:hypothetical protein